MSTGMPASSCQAGSRLAHSRENGVKTLYGSPSDFVIEPGSVNQGEPERTSSTPRSPSAFSTASSRLRP